MKTFRERFEAKVDRSGGPDACHPWTRCHDRDGYGLIRFGGRSGHNIRASRAAWNLSCGPIPHGLYVLHRCDYPPCVNPLHLFLGTNRDNLRDRDRKRRMARGESHGQGKLTEAQVREIVAMMGQETRTATAARFGVHRSMVYRIQTGKAWCHVTEDLLRADS